VESSHVVGEEDEGPFEADLCFATQRETPEAHGLLAHEPAINQHFAHRAGGGYDRFEVGHEFALVGRKQKRRVVIYLYEPAGRRNRLPNPIPERQAQRCQPSPFILCA